MSIFFKQYAQNFAAHTVSARRRARRQAIRMAPTPRSLVDVVAEAAGEDDSTLLGLEIEPLTQTGVGCCCDRADETPADFRRHDCLSVTKNSPASKGLVKPVEETRRHVRKYALMSNSSRFCSPGQVDALSLPKH